jgi:TolB-like protein
MASIAQSLLILPFKNLSPSPEQEYLSDGLTEELIAALTTYDNIRVASRTSSFYFKDKVFLLEEIREKLNVTHILEGSIWNITEQLRIINHLATGRKTEV